MLGQQAMMKRRAAVIALLALLTFLACVAGAGLAAWMTSVALDPPLDLEPLAVRLRQSVLPNATGRFISERLRSKVADNAASLALQRVLEMTIPKRPDILAAVIVSPDNRILAAYPGRERLVGRSLRSNRSAFLALPVSSHRTPDSAAGKPGGYPGPPGGAPTSSAVGGPYGSGGPPGYSGAPSSPVPPAGAYGGGGPPAPPPSPYSSSGPPGSPAGGYGGPPGYGPGPTSPTGSGPTFGGAVPFPIPSDPTSRLMALLNRAQPGGWPEGAPMTLASQYLFVLHSEGVYELTVLPRPNRPAYDFSTYYLGPASRMGAFVSFAVYWLMLPWWVYLDARPRTDKAAPLAVFVLLTNFLGWLTYLVIRPEAERLCPVCVGLMEPGYRCCPHCGWSSKAKCRQCGRPARSAWRFCPYCEAPRPDAAPAESWLSSAQGATGSHRGPAEEGEVT